MDLYLALSAVEFRVRSGDSPDLTGPFVGPDGTAESAYLSGTREMISGAATNSPFYEFHPYLQYEAEVYSDAVGSDTPYINAVKFITSDGTVIQDSSLADFGQRQSQLLMTNYPAAQSTPYLGLKRAEAGGFVASGTYRSQVFDAGAEKFWQEITWDSPSGVTDEAAPIHLWQMNGSWADAVGGVVGQPTNGATTIADTPKFGTGAARFDGQAAFTSFALNKTLRALECWVAPEGAHGGLIELNPGGGANRLALVVTNGMLALEGSAASGASLYVNASPRRRNLLPGWQHVTLNLDADLTVASLTMGSAAGQPWAGLVDDLALYDRALLKADRIQRVAQGVPAAGGRAIARVRYGNSLPLGGVFSGSYESGQQVGISGQRYFQYELDLSGAGWLTPAVRRVRVISSVGTFLNETRADFARGTFGSGTDWYGDGLQLTDLADRGPVGLSSVGAVGLAALWKMDEPSWTTPGAQAMDSAGARHGSPVGGANTEAAGGLGLYSGKFDGSGAYVALPAVSMPQNFALSIWFRSESTSKAALISTEPTVGRSYALELNSDGVTGAPAVPGRLALVATGNGGQFIAASRRGSLNDGDWHHAAAVRNGQQLQLYVDGILDQVATITGAIEDYGAGPLYMARSSGSPVVYYNGYLDDFSIWTNVVLTAGDVGRIAHAGAQSGITATFESDVLDAGGDSIWETIAWVANGRYGVGLPSIDSGLIALWRGDEASGHLLNAADGGGLTANATALAYQEAGRFDHAVGFNGSGAYAQVPGLQAGLLEPGIFSLALWVYPEADNGRALVEKRTLTQGYGLRLSDARRPQFWLSGNTCEAPVPLLREIWNHVAASYDGTVMRLYVNGQLVNTLTPVGVTVATGAAFEIGRTYNGSGYFRGRLDDIAFYGRALRDAEVVAHYRAGMGTLAFQIRSSEQEDMSGATYVGPDGSPDTWFTTPEAGNLINVTDLVPYFQFRGRIRSEDPRFTPVLHGVAVSASRYSETAPWIAPSEAIGFPFDGKLLEFHHTRSYEPDTDVRYQISGDAGPVSTARWFYYSGGRWNPQALTNTLSMYNNAANTRDEVHAQIGKFYNQIYNATGGLFRFRAFLKSDGDRSVAVSNVTVVAARGRVVVERPNGEERGPKAWIAAVPHRIEWSWDGSVSDNLQIAYSTKGYSTQESDWTEIASGVAAGAGGTNSISWTTPQPPQGTPILTNVVVRIRDLNDSNIMDMSDAPFEISQKFKVTQPDGGEYWYIGEANEIRWESAHELSTRASIYMAPDGDNPYPEDGGYQIEYLATNINASANNRYVWNTPLNVPTLLTTNAKVRVQAPNGAYADDSDNPFTMAGIVITRPEAGRPVKRDETFDIQWSAIGAGTNVHVDISTNGGLTYASNIYSFVENHDGQPNVLPWDVTQPESDEARLRMRSLSDNRVIGYSEIFTIAGIDVLSPDGGEEWMTGSTQKITWVAGGVGETVSIFYTDLYAGTNTVWIPIKERTANTLSHDWIVSDRVSPEARVMIRSDSDESLLAISEANFNIAGVKVTYPNLFDDTLIMGQEDIMTHAGAPLRWLRVKLEISYDRAGTWNLLGPSADEWTLRQPFPFTPTYPSRQTKVRATVVGATKPGGAPLTNVVDLSDDYFTVEGMVMKTPAAGSTNSMRDTSEITWVSAGAGTAVNIYYSNNGLNNFRLLEEGVFNNQTYPGETPFPWDVPETLLPSQNARIKVMSGNYQAISEPFILRGIRITSPTNSAKLALGAEDVPVTWTYAGMNVASRGRIRLSLNGGGSFSDLATDYDLISIPFYDWDVDPDLTPTTNAMIRLEILASDAPADIGFWADSDRFTLKGIKILSPTPGSTVQLGQTYTISFVSAAAGSPARIEYSHDGGQTYDPVPIVQGLAIQNGPNTFDWTVELDRTPSSNAVIRISGTEESRLSGVFTLGGIRVDRPMQYDIWAVGEVNPIEWVAEVANPVFNLDLVYPDGVTLSVAQNAAGSSRSYQLPGAALRGQGTISNVVLRVADTQGTATGLSEPFRLVSQPIIEVVSPRAGDFLRVGDEVQVVWVKGGSMNAADFTAWFSRDGFTTPPEDIGRPVTLNTNNNTFSMPWVIPDRLGDVQLMVTNSANPTLVAYSGVFKIVGSFELTFPNGDPDEEKLYANDKKAVSWFTQGSVTNVNLFYKVADQSWTPVNSQPVFNNPRAGRYQTFYEWTTPMIRTDEMILRVQDASYPDPNAFDGSRIGPYDDSDQPFGMHYFTVTWDVRYRHKNDDGSFSNKPLDKLSVTDSAGWSVTGLQSPFTTNYPYGIFDTVWYRQFFNDKVDFRWVSDRDQTRSLIMLPSDTEPDAYVLATFAYDPGLERLTIHSWIERGGRVLNNPDSTTIHIFDTDGTKLRQMGSTEVLADGFFRLRWENVLDPFTAPNGETRQLSERETYLARVEVMYNRVIYSAAVTYTLSLAPEFEQVQSILDRVQALETNLSGRIGNIDTNLTELSGITSAFRTEAMAELGEIKADTENIEGGMEDVVRQVGSLTNTFAAPLSALTNQMVEVLGPTLTNMAEQVEDILESTAGEQARILNRPTTVEYGSTNTILYKTTRGLDAGTVRLTVEGAGRQYNMFEVGTGIGIYSADVIADWGLGPYVISCADPTASDRMVLEVVSAGAEDVAELSETIAGLESQMTNMTEIMEMLNDPTAGLSAIMSAVDSSIAQIESALGEAIAAGGGAAGGAVEGAVSDLGSLIEGEGDAAGSSLLGSLAGMSGRLESIFGSASDAAKFALSAKNEAGSAANAVRELRTLLTGEDSVDSLMARLSAIRDAVNSANANISGISRSMGMQALQSQIQAVADQIRDLAAREGFEYEVEVAEPGVGGAGGEGGDVPDEEVITVLNQNMNEVKISLEFMQKVLDEKMNEPVVMESWMGVE